MPNDTIITCPYCRTAVPADTAVCPDCQEDLSAILRLRYGHAIYYNQALALAREGKLDEAIAKALLAVECKQDFAPGHVLLAKAYAQRGEWSKAEASATRAIELEPENESLGGLVEEIRQAMHSRAVARHREEEQAALSRRRSAEQAMTAYERDLKRAFGLGVGVTAFFALVLSLLGGKKKRR
ncbi:MAG: tetratricopeptide repeat protein [Chloroflexi bacterium]|jgi:tetratricopeptide (TPR) repeat protein|nr:tetratricopeptide repeat protein [Chloroflexota bacterium]